MDPLLVLAQSRLGALPRLLAVEERRHSRILRVEVDQGASSRRLIIKQVRGHDGDKAAQMRAEQRIHAEYEALCRIHQGFDPGEGFIAVRPVAFLAEAAALVMEEAPGVPMNRVLQGEGVLWPSARAQRRLETLCELAGRWLARFQDFTRTAEDPQRHLEALISEVESLLGTLAARSRVRLPESLARGLRDFMERAIRQARGGALEVTGMTGEFCPANILVAGDRLVVLDFGLYAPGLALNDLVLFHHHLDTFGYHPLWRPATTGALQTAFLEGFGRPELASDPLFSAFRVKFKLSRLDATSGRRWASYDLPHRLYYRRVWGIQLRELRDILATHE